MGFMLPLPPHDEKVLLFHCFKKKEEGDMEASALADERKLPEKNAATAKRAAFHLSAAPSLSCFCLSSSPFLPLSLTPGDVQYGRIRSHIENSLGGVSRFFLSVHLLGCAPQWVSVLLRMRQLHVVLFCWAFRKCLCEYELMCVWAALHYRAMFFFGQQPAVSYGMWHFPTVVSVSKRAS